MKQVKKSILLWYSTRQMFDLVRNVRDYPAFMPWCERAEVSDETDLGMTARLYLGYRGVRQSFTTRNTHVPERSVSMQLVDGPFSTLDGLWQFLPVGDGQACRIQFELSYAFSSRALEAVVSPVFDRIADTFVDAFVQRAEQVYGSR